MGWRSDPLHCGCWSFDPFAETLQHMPGFVYCRTHLVKQHLKALGEAGDVALVTSASDAVATNAVRGLLPSNIRSWWSNNAGGFSVSPLPIGFVWANNFIEAQTRALATPRSDLNLLFVSHAEDSHRPWREGLYQRFGLPWVTRFQGGCSLDDYYAYLRSHPFVLAPEGAGPDTHRLWEALAIGCVPIVLDSAVHREWKHLPVLWVNNWDEVTESRLLAELPSFAGKTGEPMPELTGTYWREKICA